MRSLVLIAATLLGSASVAWPCAAPPPMRSVLELVTAPGATLPANGAILVTRTEVPDRGGNGPDRDDAWTLQDGAGHDVDFTVEELCSSVERWVPQGAEDRDLVILDRA